MSSSSSVAKAKRGVVSSLHGPRPLPLSLPGTTSPPRPAKRRRVVNSSRGDGDDVRAPPAAAAGPVVVYENTPKVIHARPDEFNALVQRLTGPQPTVSGCSDLDQYQEAELLPAAVPSSSSSQPVQDPLMLALGQQQVVVQLPPPLTLDDHQHHYTPLPVLQPSPGGATGDFLLSPSSFPFSPATMQAIQELIS